MTTRDGVVGFDLNVLDLANAVALVEDVDGFHVFLSLKALPGRECPKRSRISNRGGAAKPESVLRAISAATSLIAAEPSKRKADEVGYGGLAEP